MKMISAVEGFAALAQETRLALLRLLVAAGPGGIRAGDAARRLGVPPSTLSAHLAVLTRAGLATFRREGRAIIYAPDLDGVRALVDFLLHDCCGGDPALCGLPVHTPPERPPMDITIWHNPACGTSRNVLALIRHSGAEPRIVEYLRTPPTREAIADAARRAGLTPRQLLREKGTPFTELGLGDPTLGDDALLEAMAAHPILINRPVVFTPLGVRLCRPSETVLDILPNPPPTPFTKEDGEVVPPRG